MGLFRKRRPQLVPPPDAVRDVVRGLSHLAGEEVASSAPRRDGPPPPTPAGRVVRAAARAAGSAAGGGPFAAIASVVRDVSGLLKDNKGKMSSKRFGAGALVAAGIALLNEGAAAEAPMQFWGGIACMVLGVALFGLTRWEPGANGKDEHEQHG